MKKYIGQIEMIISENKQFRSILFKIINEKSSFIKISGNLSTMKPGNFYSIVLDNEKIKDKNSFNAVKEYNLVENWTDEDIIYFLSSDLFPTVDLRDATTIRDQLVPNVYNKITSNPEIINKTNISHDSKKIIITILKNNYNIEKNIQNTFIKYELSQNILEKLYSIFDNPKELLFNLKNNFYYVAEKFEINNFESVDRIAISFGEALDSDLRYSYYTKNEIKKWMMQTGDTYIEFDNLIKIIKKIPNLPIVPNEEIIKKLNFAKENNILNFFEKKVYTNEYWESEEIISKYLFKQKNKKSKLYEEIDFEKTISKIENLFTKKNYKNKFKFNNEQREVMSSIIDNDFLVVTGGPGTGKSTLISGIVEFYKEVSMNQNFLILTPTGRAASRINDMGDYDAKTIHRYIAQNNFDTKKIYNSVDILLIDETTMVDNLLFSNLLSLIDNVEKIILIGDIDQLPSIAPGRLFNDIVTSNKFKEVKLFINNRQDINKKNGIIDISRSIISNSLDSFDFNGYENLKLYDLEDQNSNEILNSINDLYNKIKPPSLEEELYNIQIIVPMNKYEFGTTNINKNIQLLTNPTSEIIIDFFKTTYKKNDKVMFTENTSSLDLFNGDVGYIVSSELSNTGKLKSIKCYFNERIVSLNSENFYKLILSYACTIHKTQGSEYNNVILIIDPFRKNFNEFINKNMIYTAITRAKENIYIFAKKADLINYCKLNPKPRNSTLINKIFNLFN